MAKLLGEAAAVEMVEGELKYLLAIDTEESNGSDDGYTSQGNEKNKLGSCGNLSEGKYG